MNATSRRNRLVYFRISEEEFQQMVDFCNAKGARNISELARQAVQEFMKSPRQATDPGLDEAISALQAIVGEVKATMQKLLPEEPSAGAEQQEKKRSTPELHSVDAEESQPAVLETRK